eukprot:3018672-Pyramimonas_sp.AAC.1
MQVLMMCRQNRILLSDIPNHPVVLALRFEKAVPAFLLPSHGSWPDNCASTAAPGRRTPPCR